MTALTVFGTKPQDAIFLPNQPFAVRNNCQVGQWAVGDDDYRGSQLEMSIIKVSQFFGNLGKTKNTQWIQIFFVPVPSCDSKPKGTVCVSYIKTRSASAFWQKVTEVMEFNEPAEGIFKASFEKHSGDMGTYYSLKWDWRERQTAEELEQLEAIAVFLQSQPRLVDLNATREMMCIDALSASEISSLVCSAKSGELEQPLQISAETRK